MGARVASTSPGVGHVVDKLDQHVSTPLEDAYDQIRGQVPAHPEQRDPARHEERTDTKPPEDLPLP